MEFRLLSLFLYIMTSVLFSTLSYAQTECSKKFDLMSEACIIQNKKNLLQTQYDLALLNKGDVFFYYTSAGHYGKFFVDAAYQDKGKCLLYISPETFVNGRSTVPNDRLLEITPRFNEWPTAVGNLDTVNTDAQSDLSVRYDRANAKCVVLSDKGYFVKHTTIVDDLVGGSPILYYAALGLIFLAVYLVANAVFEEEDKFKASEKLEDAGTEIVKKEDVDGFVLKYSRPFFKRYFSPIVQNMRKKKNIKEKYRRKLASAGLGKKMTPEDFYAFKLFLIIGFPIVFLGLRAFLEETWPLSLTPVIAVIGYFYPDIWLKGMIETRQERIVQGMPFIVDMLALSVEAGLDFVAAMTKVIEKAPPSPLSEEFETMIKEIKIGSSRAEGLRQLSWRVDVLSISSFTATLIAADSVGASIGPILKQLSIELRQKRSSDAEKKGATAATKILFPMMMFIIPSVFIIIAAPIALQFIGGG
jgi:tight adherence protein C